MAPDPLLQPLSNSPSPAPQARESGAKGRRRRGAVTGPRAPSARVSRARRVGVAPARVRALRSGWRGRTRARARAGSEAGRGGRAARVRAGEGRCGSAGTPAPAAPASLCPPPGGRGKRGRRWWGRGGVGPWASWGRSAVATAAAPEDEGEEEAEALLSSSQTRERPERRARNWGTRRLQGARAR